MEAPKHLLVVGEEPAVRDLVDRLFAEGFEVAFCTDATATWRHIQQHGLPHLLIVGVELPGVDGLALCQQLQALADLPIIVLSRQDKPGLAAKALQYADDYIRQPVAPDELVMRIRRVLSRITNFSYAAGPRIEICENLTLDPLRRRVIVDGEERQLTPTENVLLQVLLKHWGRVVETDTLIERVWRTGISIQDRNSLRVHMHRLRQKLEPKPDSPSLILTERGQGYVFVGC